MAKNHTTFVKREAIPRLVDDSRLVNRGFHTPPGGLGIRLITFCLGSPRTTA